MTGKYGTPYFANFINSDLDINDVRSMALLGCQDIIYKRGDGRVTSSKIDKMVKNWDNYDIKPNYEVLMNGKFVPIIDMFQVPYKNEDKSVEITLENGYTQSFSLYHKCHVYSDGEFKIIESQDLKETDNFVISSKPWGINTGIGNYESGKILGYYLAEGWKRKDDGAQIIFAININEDSIVNDIKIFFQNMGCEVKIEPQPDVNIYRVNVYGKQAVGFVEQYITGDSAKTKRLNHKLWNTNDEFREGLYEGYLNTDGCRSASLLAHTTNRHLCDDLIKLASSIGKILSYSVNKNNTRSFKSDKSDKVKFTSYKLRIISPKEVDGFYIIPVKSVKLKSHSNDVVYNFTVDTDEHLFELPNGIITHQCCRLRLDLSELRKRNGGLFGAGDSTGSIGVVTINLPRIAYENKNDKEGFYKDLEHYLSLAKDSLDIKRKWLQENIIETNAVPAFMEYVGTLDNHFSTIGEIGKNEMCLNFFGKDILDEEAYEFSLEVGDFVKSKLIEYQHECGCLFNYEATPAESTCYRLALADKKVHPDIITQGSGNDCYYTNSCHIPVKDIKSIDSTFKHQERLQTQYSGGTVIHCYLEGAISGEQAKSIVKSMCENYRVPYMSLSPISRYCDEHGYIEETVTKCPICKSKLKMYQRITGYLRCVDNFNKGKKAEFKDREQISVNRYE